MNYGSIKICITAIIIIKHKFMCESKDYEVQQVLTLMEYI